MGQSWDGFAGSVWLTGLTIKMQRTRQSVKPRESAMSSGHVEGGIAGISRQDEAETITSCKMEN